jgi:1-deoxy-D-xylulose-5-phosphate synthase
VPLLDSIDEPADLRGLNPAELVKLAAEIRAFLISNVSRTGGHLGPNLGVVELTLALHRVFDSPNDAIIWDTGHQSYVHKIVTGRKDFSHLRQAGGLSGYPNRAESEHDWVENSHASTSLSWAAGLAEAFRLRGEKRLVVPVIGDGALTGGMAWEALNNIAAQDDLPIIIVVNDNGRSYTPTVGGLATQLSGLGKQLTAIRTDRRYERGLLWFKTVFRKLPVIGEPIYGLLHGLKRGVKDVLVPQGMFSDLGLKYVGPINGHDVAAVELALQQAKRFGGPVIVHCITEKGRGYALAEENEADRFHAIGRIDENTGEPLEEVSGRSWTEAFEEELARIGATDESVVALTAAMLNPTGIGVFAKHFPQRVFDVGIAEQYAVTSAAGLARGGMHPVVAVYSSFMNRAFDQVLMDVGLHGLGVTFVLDRAGVTGPDGPSHHGMWDLSAFGMVPGLRVAVPRDEPRLQAALRTAIGVSDAPTLLRYPKGVLPAPVEPVATREGIELLREDDEPRVLLVSYGMTYLGLEVGSRLAAQGIGCTIADPVWALPVADGLVKLAAEHALVVTVEDGLVSGGLGSQLAQSMLSSGVVTPVLQRGLPKQFLGQGSRSMVLAEAGLDVETLVSRITAAYAQVLRVG